MPGALVLCLLSAMPFGVSRAAEPVFDIDIPAMNAAEALNRLAEQTGSVMLFSYDLARTREANAVRGRYALLEGLELLLRDTGLSGGLSDRRVVIIADEGNMPAGKGEIMKKRGLMASIIAVLAGSNSIEVRADQDSGPSKLEEIVVTAQKREERLMDVPISISAFTNDVLADSGAAQLADFLENAPGVGIIDNGSGGLRMQIRGINSITGDAAVGYYLDELPFSLINATDLPDVRTYDLERVEVLRGPQGTLYGDGSIGGTIRILTREPNLTALQASADLSGTQTDGGEGSYAAKGMFNLPLKEEVLGLRVVASKEDFGGWIDNTATGVEDENDRTVENYRAKLRIAPTDNMDVSLSAWHSRGDSVGGALSRADRTLSILPTTYATDYDLYSATLRYQFAGFDLVSATSKMDSTSDTLGSLLNFPLIFHTTSDVLAQELRLTSNSAGVLRWTGGVFYRMNEQGFTGQFFGISLPKTRWESESYGAFGEVTWSAIERRIDVTLGLRHFSDDRMSDSPVDPATLALIQTLDPSFTGHVTAGFESLSPRLNVAWHPDKNWLLYTNVAKGFRSGQTQAVPSLIGAILSGVTVPVAINPETLWSYEVGTKGSLADGRLQIEGALYYNDWRDLQVNGVVPPSLFVTFNGGGARTVGVELGATYSPLDGLTMRLAGSHLSAEYTKSVTGTPIQDGDRIGQVPETSVSVAATYRRPFTANLRGFAYGSAQYTSDRVDVVRDALPSDETTIMDFRLGLEGRAWSAFVFVDNLTDEDGAMDVILAENDGATTRPKPRTYGLTVRFNFD